MVCVSEWGERDAMRYHDIAMGNENQQSNRIEFKLETASRRDTHIRLVGANAKAADAHQPLGLVQHLLRQVRLGAHTDRVRAANFDAQVLLAQLGVALDLGIEARVSKSASERASERECGCCTERVRAVLVIRSVPVRGKYRPTRTQRLH